MTTDHAQALAAKLQTASEGIRAYADLPGSLSENQRREMYARKVALADTASRLRAALDIATSRADTLRAVQQYHRTLDAVRQECELQALDPRHPDVVRPSIAILVEGPDTAGPHEVLTPDLIARLDAHGLPRTNGQYVTHGGLRTVVARLTKLEQETAEAWTAVQDWVTRGEALLSPVTNAEHR
jgi:hypothetical protein